MQSERTCNVKQAEMTKPDVVIPEMTMETGKQKSEGAVRMKIGIHLTFAVTVVKAFSTLRSKEHKHMVFMQNSFSTITLPNGWLKPCKPTLPNSSLANCSLKFKQNVESA